jgi:hypothetical protein
VEKGYIIADQLRKTMEIQINKAGSRVTHHQNGCTLFKGSGCDLGSSSGPSIIKHQEHIEELVEMRTAEMKRAKEQAESANLAKREKAPHSGSRLSLKNRPHRKMLLFFLSI